MNKRKEKHKKKGIWLHEDNTYIMRARLELIMAHDLMIIESANTRIKSLEKKLEEVTNYYKEHGLHEDGKGQVVNDKGEVVKLYENEKGEIVE
jgi:hypothetical protein